MRKVFIAIVVLVMGASAYPPALSTTGPAFNAHPGPPTEYEFYWDDGIVSSCWVWFTAGNYWAVKFDQAKTGGADGYVTKYGAVAYPDWPDSTYQGCYMHTFEDVGGYPGSSLDNEYLGFTQGGVFEWVYPGSPVFVDGGVFYIAFRQFGNYPYTDAIGVDAVAGTHNWTGYQGSWAPSTAFSDFMIRCYWNDEIPEDDSSPYVTGMDPADGAEDVPVDTTIVFHVVDDISGVDVATIEFTVEDASKNVHSFALAFNIGGLSPIRVISGTLYIDDDDLNDVVCIFFPDDDLPEGETITCTVDGTLADCCGNRMGEDFVWTFTTKDYQSVEDTTWGRVKALY
ncbi:MAG TPA: Ig-like domain-containing protein [bacterium]|nr:Ig-like domain-containing protein [bacterium]